jgi:hypothetical protein
MALAASTTPAKPAVDPTIEQPGWKAPHNEFGQPDFSGYWTNATLTPMTRNPKLSDSPTLPPAQAKAMEKAFADALDAANKPTDPNAEVKAPSGDSKLTTLRPEFAAAGGDVGGYNAGWLDPGNHIMEVNGEYRTSLLTTANGQVPPRKGQTGAAPGFRGGLGSFDSYETRSLGERCIMGFGRNAGPPMLPNGFYNNDYYIIQTPETVAIQIEMVHDIRTVHLNAKHRTDGLRPWMGDSIGHFEGDTLVVETTNFPREMQLNGSWKNLKVTERFKRVSPTRINYSFQVEDPDTWDKPWGGEYDFAPMQGIIYEYACHEGNYALPSMLAGARRQEQEAAASTTAPAAAPAQPAAPAKATGKPGASR